MNSHNSHNSLLVGAIACTLWMPSSRAGLLTLNDGGVSNLEVVARDRSVSSGNAIANLFPASLPFDESHVATMGGSYSMASYHLGQDGFSIATSGVRAGSIDSRANVQPMIIFSVSIDTPYDIAGTLSVDSPNLSGRFAGLNATLKDLNTSKILFFSNQSSFGVVDQTFVLGGAAGNFQNELTGSPKGLLLAGHRYSLFYGTSIYANTAGDPASFEGTFSFSVPEPMEWTLGMGALCLATLLVRHRYILRTWPM